MVNTEDVFGVFVCMIEKFPLYKDEFDRRIAMSIEYDGGAYNGWQTQNSGVPTIQQTLEAALSKIANHPVKVICSGRTDTGVHASNQIIHFDTCAERKLFGWGAGVNKNLPRDISVNWVKEVPLVFMRVLAHKHDATAI